MHGIQDIISIGIAAGGYFCGGISMAVYAYRIENVYFNTNQAAANRVHSSAAAASVSKARVRLL
jgi:hypothetical protein